MHVYVTCWRNEISTVRLIKVLRKDLLVVNVRTLWEHLYLARKVSKKLFYLLDGILMSLHLLVIGAKWIYNTIRRGRVQHHIEIVVTS
jgi:hypothetical protein